MRLNRWQALGGALLITLFLQGCATTKKPVRTAIQKPPPPTPAELLAIKHYKLGIDSYANDQYAEAIRHWKITVKEDPKNANAAEYIGRAENMMKAVKSASKAKKNKVASTTLPPPGVKQ